MEKTQCKPRSTVFRSTLLKNSLKKKTKTKNMIKLIFIKINAVLIESGMFYENATRQKTVPTWVWASLGSNFHLTSLANFSVATDRPPAQQSLGERALHPHQELSTGRWVTM